MTDPWRAVYDEAYELLIRKNRDYGTEAISGAPSGPIAAVLNKLWERICRLKNLHQAGREPNFEDFEGGAIDLLNFAAMLVLVIRDQWDSGPEHEEPEQLTWEEYQRLAEAPTVYSESPVGIADLVGAMRNRQTVVPAPSPEVTEAADAASTMDDTVAFLLTTPLLTSDGRFFRLTEVLPDTKVKAVDPDAEPWVKLLGQGDALWPT